MSDKKTMATVWLDGCSGCHMSFLDMDERLIDVAAKIELVYSPLVDRKDYPQHVDVALIEGAVATDEDLVKIRKIRAHTDFLISLGDCAITGNVPAMRNRFEVNAILQHAYEETADAGGAPPSRETPTLLDRIRPVHEVVDVDLHVPGCPPAADTIHFALTELLEGRRPDLSTLTRFGA